MISIAKAVIERIVCRYGLFETLVSDRGSVFVGSLAAHIYKALKIQRITTSAYHPQGNAIIERFHHTLKTTLKLWSLETKEEWDDLLPYALFAYNTAYHTILQEVPHFLNHGYEARLPIDVVLTNRDEQYGDIHQYAVEMIERLQLVHTRIRDILATVQQEMSEDEHIAKIIKLNIGEKVWLFDPTTKKHETASLKVRWQGPYTVISKNSPVNYTIVNDADGRQQRVHVARLKKKTDDDSAPASAQVQLELIEKEIESIKQRQLDLLTRQRQRESERESVKQRLIDSPQHDSGSLEVEEEDNEEDREVSELAAIMMQHLRAHSIKWL
jgi:hypothetical protein